MADDLGREPLLSELIDPSHEASKDTTSKKRFRRCQSAPLVNVSSESTRDTTLYPDPKSIFVQFNPSLRQLALFLAIYLGVGTVCFFMVNDQIKGGKTNGILDALYFCIVTMTTVGYGDLVPDSVTTKLLACAFVFSGMAIVGLLLSKGADYLVEKQEALLIKALYARHKVERQILKEIESNRIKYKFLVTTVSLLLLTFVGTMFLSKVEKLSLVDSFYCVCSTITTLGYGDKSFSTKGGRIFAVFWILTSTICVAQFFLYLAELQTERRQQQLAKWVLNRRMTFMDLKAADLDYDGVLSAAEFVIYKLKEMGKIRPEDIALVLEEFENLDVDQSGTLTTSDLVLAQSTN